MSPFLRLAAGAPMLLASCGGGSGGETDYVVNPEPGGIWRGTDAITGLAAVCIVDYPGHFHVIRADGVQVTGTAVTAPGAIVANFEGFTEFAHNGITFTGLATFDNTVSPQQVLAGVTDTNGSANYGLVDALVRS